MNRLGQGCPVPGRGPGRCFPNEDGLVAMALGAVAIVAAGALSSRFGTDREGSRMRRSIRRGRLGAPPIGAIVEYGRDMMGRPRRHRVSGYFTGTRERLVHSTRAEAQWVGATGVAFVLIPLDEVKVVGMVPWSSETIAQEQRRVASSVGRRVW